jgi:hypothetical protein
MRPRHLGVGVLLAGVVGCGSGTREHGQHGAEGHEHAAAAAGHDAAAQDAPEHPATLVLDHGARWSTDASTRAVMSETRATLAAAEVRSVDEARALGARLQEQLDRLVRGCTMTGAAHDQLHVFLSGYAPAVTALRRAEDLDVARARLDDLRARVAAYDRFFA